MKKRARLKEQVVSALEMPSELAYHDSIVTLTGPREVLVENYRCICRYTPEEIVVLTLRGKVTICGKGLEILWYTPREMKIKGCISGIFPQGQV
ncbi:MAG: YabP/YqfC family sporulation protein [Blautia sp.]|nr:YabP/YqfC family sporulation protein [Blautia sp.]